jgi:aminocarboxymuconate-semialdehyde decarboxylase
VRYIDAFNHFFPRRYFDALLESPSGAKDIGKRVRGIPALFELDQRGARGRAVRELYAGASHGLPPVERLFPR